MGSSLRPLAVIACSLLLAAAAGARVAGAQIPGTQTAAPPVMGGSIDSALDNGNFHFSTDARATLIALWKRSTEVNAERVACIGGHSENGVAYVDTVQELAGQDADSMQVQAVVSIEQCHPPQWFGTVHTHIVKYKGQLPYSTFSGADRGVIAQWHRTWKSDGVFCILFSDVQAHCESGYDQSGDAIYARRYGGEPPTP